MTTPIKSQVMVALGEALSSIPELATVNRYRGKPLDLETTPLPAMFIFEVEPERRQRENRMQIGILSIALSVFFKLDLGSIEEAPPEQGFIDEADSIQAKVHSLLFGTNNLTSFGVLKVEEGDVHKEYPNDTYGILIMHYQIVYGHQFGNAFTTTAK